MAVALIPENKINHEAALRLMVPIKNYNNNITCK